MSDAFSEAEQRGVYRAIYSRRDVRSRFRNEPLPEGMLERLLRAAHAAPSVGLMQPWRFVRIRSQSTRRAIYSLVAEERLRTADALGERREQFLDLKVEAIRECAELVVIGLMDRREEHVFGRRTLPQMDVASVGCAVENLWLAARAEGVGVGWVSILDPVAVADLLAMPKGSEVLGALCLGFVDEFDDRPALEKAGWASRAPLTDLVFEDRWGQPTSDLQAAAPKAESSSG